MTDINITNYYFRAEEVLLSCTNSTQLKNSLNYIKLYYKLSGDYCGYEILLRKYDKRINELG
ncbi:hypothetical protein N9145_01075 [bacterium]|jgi:hypothetical protein|nr:hypothetical protein [bacterium]|tara:strand:+ start:533 stop:718 length:186 start_codon:yes stop_codon:yes gene_type:complete